MQELNEIPPSQPLPIASSTITSLHQFTKKSKLFLAVLIILVSLLAGIAVIKMLHGDVLLSNGRIVNMGEGIEIVPGPISSPTQETSPTATTQPDITEIPGYITYTHQRGLYSFRYPVGWTLTSDRYWADISPETFDNYVEVTTPDGEIVTLKAFENVTSTDLAELEQHYLYPVLINEATPYGTGTIQGNVARLVIEPGVPDERPTVMYSFFECRNTVYSIQYVAYVSGSNLQDFQDILYSFDCHDTGSSTLPEIQPTIFVDASQIL